MNKPSTELGDIIGYSVRGMASLFDYIIPVTGLAAYRLIPDNVRGNAFGGPSTSQMTMFTLLQTKGNGWSILRNGVSNHPDRPSLP